MCELYNCEKFIYVFLPCWSNSYGTHVNEGSGFESWTGEKSATNHAESVFLVSQNCIIFRYCVYKLGAKMWLKSFFLSISFVFRFKNYTESTLLFFFYGEKFCLYGKINYQDLNHAQLRSQSAGKHLFSYVIKLVWLNKILVCNRALTFSTFCGNICKI